MHLLIKPPSTKQKIRRSNRKALKYGKIETQPPRSTHKQIKDLIHPTLQMYGQNLAQQMTFRGEPPKKMKTSHTCRQGFYPLRMTDIQIPVYVTMT